MAVVESTMVGVDLDAFVVSLSVFSAAELVNKMGMVIIKVKQFKLLKLLLFTINLHQMPDHTEDNNHHMDNQASVNNHMANQAMVNHHTVNQATANNHTANQDTVNHHLNSENKDLLLFKSNIFKLIHI